MPERRESLSGLRFHWGYLAVAWSCLALPASWAGEGPFFITYTHQMEGAGKPGDRYQERHRQADEWEPVSG